MLGMEPRESCMVKSSLKEPSLGVFGSRMGMERLQSSQCSPWSKQNLIIGRVTCLPIQEAVPWFFRGPLSNTVQTILFALLASSLVYVCLFKQLSKYLFMYLLLFIQSVC